MGYPPEQNTMYRASVLKWSIKGGGGTVGSGLWQTVKGGALSP